MFSPRNDISLMPSGSS